MITFPVKEQFVLHDAVNMFEVANPQTPALWGKMNLTQTVEHLQDVIKMSYTPGSAQLAIPEEQLPAYKAFLMSDKMFKQNTKAPSSIAGDEPAAIRSSSFAMACENLRATLQSFHSFFQSHPRITTTHPAFGELNYEEWIQLHYKHLHHHLSQFGLLPED